MKKRLYRSRTDRMLWGVCGGLAEYFNIDPTIVRLIAVLSIFLNGLGILAYIILAIVVPLESSAATEPKEVVKENIEEMKETATQFGQEMRSTFQRDEARPREAPQTSQHTYIALGIILVVIGGIFLLANFLSWMAWRYLWPLILIAIGLVVIFRPRRS